MNKYYPPDLVAKCRQANIFDIMLSIYPSDWCREGNYIRHKEKDSLVITRKGHWYRNSDGDTGKNPIDFLCRYYDHTFSSAVSMVSDFIGTNYSEAPTSENVIKHTPPKQAPKPWYRTINYMLSRCIPAKFTQSLFDKGILYEALYNGYHNVCFINPSNGHFESTGMNWQDKSKRFKQVSDASGYWIFSPNVTHKCSVAVICESSIDCISCYLLNHIDADYISICGCNSRRNLINQILNDYAEVIIAVDNDDAGNALAAHYSTLKRIIPHAVKDWNDMLRLQNKND